MLKSKLMLYAGAAVLALFIFGGFVVQFSAQDTAAKEIRSRLGNDVSVKGVSLSWYARSITLTDVRAEDGPTAQQVILSGYSWPPTRKSFDHLDNLEVAVRGFHLKGNGGTERDVEAVDIDIALSDIEKDDQLSLSVNATSGLLEGNLALDLEGLTINALLDFDPSLFQKENAVRLVKSELDFTPSENLLDEIAEEEMEKARLPSKEEAKARLIKKAKESLGDVPGRHKASIETAIESLFSGKKVSISAEPNRPVGIANLAMSAVMGRMGLHFFSKSLMNELNITID